MINYFLYTIYLFLIINNNFLILFSFFNNKYFYRKIFHDKNISICKLFYSVLSNNNNNNNNNNNILNDSNCFIIKQTSDGKGNGIFSSIFIPKNTFIGYYEGCCNINIYCYSY